MLKDYFTKVDISITKKKKTLYLNGH